MTTALENSFAWCERGSYTWFQARSDRWGYGSIILNQTTGKRLVHKRKRVCPLTTKDHKAC